MLWSIHATTMQYLEHHERSAPAARRNSWARCWIRWISAAFLHGYLQTAGEAAFVPQVRADQSLLLDALLIEKTIQALDRDLREEPERVPDALQQLRAVLGTEQVQAAARG